MSTSARVPAVVGLLVGTGVAGVAARYRSSIQAAITVSAQRRRSFPHPTATSSTPRAVLPACAGTPRRRRWLPRPEDPDRRGDPGRRVPLDRAARSQRLLAMELPPPRHLPEGGTDRQASLLRFILLSPLTTPRSLILASLRALMTRRRVTPARPLGRNGTQHPGDPSTGIDRPRSFWDDTRDSPPGATVRCSGPSAGHRRVALRPPCRRTGAPAGRRRRRCCRVAPHRDHAHPRGTTVDLDREGRKVVALAGNWTTPGCRPSSSWSAPLPATWPGSSSRPPATTRPGDRPGLPRPW